MAVIGCIVLGLFCAALGVRVYTAERSLRGAARQLREAEASHSSARLLMDAPNGAAEELIAAVNTLLELRQADEAAYRAREHALRQQIANISHDLRTPLTSILGYLQLLEGDRLTGAERAEYLAVVESRAKALQSLITSFYDLSRLEGGEFPLSREKVDLAQTISGLLAAFYNDFMDAGFDVNVDLCAHLPPVAADPAGVLRVFTNLIRNALDHGQGRLSVRLFAEDGVVVSECSNGADGMTEEDVAQVFDRFFTSDKMRTGRNTGLGLAIVKALTQQMGHTVDARLENGFFTVRIQWKCLL